MNNSANHWVILLVAIIGLVGVIITAVIARESGERAAVERAIEATMTAEAKLASPTAIAVADLPTPIDTSSPATTNIHLPTATLTNTPTPPTDTPRPTATNTRLPTAMSTETPQPTPREAIQDESTCGFIDELIAKGNITQVLQGNNGIAGVQIGLNDEVDVPAGWIVHNMGEEYSGPIHFDAGTFASFWSPVQCRPLIIREVASRSQTNPICGFIDELVSKGQVQQVLQGSNGIAGVQIQLEAGVDVPAGWTVHIQGQTHNGPIHFGAGTFGSFWAPSWCEPLIISR